MPCGGEVEVERAVEADELLADRAVDRVLGAATGAAEARRRGRSAPAVGGAAAQGEPVDEVALETVDADPTAPAAQAVEPSVPSVAPIEPVAAAPS